MSVTQVAARQQINPAGPTIHSGQATVDFGFAATSGEGDLATITVTGQAWITASSVIIVSAPTMASTDHDPEDASLEGLTCHAGNLVPGVGFDVIVQAPQGTWGQYLINWMGF